MRRPPTIPLRALHLALLLFLLPLAEPAAARTIEWSGYTWQVREDGFGAPGPNHWSDAPESVRVDGSDLVLSMTRDPFGNWASTEVAGPHLGYGTYRWVVASDLRKLDPHDVLGLFTYGGAGPSHNEIDIEPSRWGSPAWPSGSVTVWEDADRGHKQSRTFEYRGRPPFVNQFTWRPGAVRYVVSDGAGRTLLDWTVTRGVPTPSSEVPMINYWRVDGTPPAAQRNVRLSAFTWRPLRARQPSPPPARVRMAVRPRRIAVAARQSPTIHWQATARAHLELAVQRRVRGGGVTRVATLERSVHAGSGRIRFSGRRFRPGAYRVAVTARGGDVRFTPRRLRFTVLGR